MAYPPGDLAILSAEVYDDSPAFASAGRPPVTRKPPSAPGPSQRGAAEGPRKRTRTQTAEDAEAAEGEDDKKRSRGRPRLDTKDETAADVS
jgi:hypothetical protein